MGFWNKFYNARKYQSGQPLSTRPLFFGSKTLYVNEETAMTVAAFNRGVLYVATQMAKLPWHVKDNQFNTLTNNNIAKLLNRNPNPEMTSFNLRCFLMIQAIVCGNGYLEIERDVMGRPVRLWPILSRDVQPYRFSNGELFYRISGGSAGNGIINMRPKDIFHLRNFHTHDGILGSGVVDFARETIAISSGADQFASSLFANAGMPSGTLNVEGKLSIEASERLKESWQSVTAGRKTGSTAVLEQGVTYTPVSLAPDVLQFIETRKFGVIEISRFLGVPPSKLYDQEQSTYNNIEQENLAVANDTLDPWARNLEGEADKKLLNDDMSKNTQLDLFEVFRGDMTTRSDFYTRMVGIGSMTPNQVRAKEAMSPHDDGDQYYIQTNNLTPMNRIDEVIDSQVNNKDNEDPDKEMNKEIINILNNKR